MKLPNLLLALAVLSPVCLSFADDTPSNDFPSFQPGTGISEESIQELVEWALEKFKTPGAGVAIVKDGEVFLAEGYGIRNSETGEPVTADTVFQLASVSKTFTATAFASAVDRKLLKWDQPACEVLPDFQMYEDYATKWVDGTDFLVHRSGFPGFFGDLFDHFGYSRTDIVHRLRFVEPGYSFRNHPEYSNLGFFLAGEMVAVADKTTFEEAVHSAILDPLDMTETGKAETLLKTNPVPNAAASHVWKDGAFAVVPHNLSKVFVSAGGLASTANDLASYMQMLVNGGKFGGQQVIGEDALSQTFEPVIAAELSFSEFPPIDENSGYDYSPGWGVYYYNGMKVLEKGGALDGVRTIVVLIPEENFGIAVLANMNLTALPEAVRAGVMQQMFGLPGEENMEPAIVAKAKKIEELLFGSEEKPAPAPDLSESQINAFVGSYNNDLFGVWEVAKDKDADSSLVLLCGPDEYRGSIKLVDEDTLSVSWPIVLSGPSEVDFEIVKGENASSFTFEDYTFRRLGNTK